MSGGGGGGDTTTTTEPWEGVRPFLKHLYDETRSLHDTMGGPTGFTPSELLGQQLLMRTAGNRPPPIYGQAGETVRDMMRTQPENLAGYEQAYRTATGASRIPNDAGYEMAMRMAGRGGEDPTDQAYNLAYRTAQGQYLTPQHPYWSGMAQTQAVSQGKYLKPGSNPYLKGMYEASVRPLTEEFQQSLLPSLTAQFSSAGRLGAGAQQNVQTQALDDLTRRMGDLSNQFYGGAYESERGRQEAATRALQQQYMGERGLQQQAQGMLNERQAQQLGLQQGYLGMANERLAQERALQEAAAGRLGNYAQLAQQAQQFGVGAAPGVGQLGRNWNLQNAQLMGDVGIAQRQLAEQQRMWPLDLLSRESGLYGSGTPFTSQTTPYYTNPAAGALGGALSGAGMGSMIMPGWGTAIGGALGGLGGFFM